MVAHDVHQRERVAQVVGVVLDGLLHRLAHGLEAGKVNHAVDLVVGEDLLQGLTVVDVGPIKGQVLGAIFAHDGVDAVDDLLRRVGEVVHDDGVVACIEQLDHGVAANEPGTAGDEDGRILRKLLLTHAIPFG